MVLGLNLGPVLAKLELSCPTPHTPSLTKEFWGRRRNCTAHMGRIIQSSSGNYNNSNFLAAISAYLYFKVQIIDKKI